MSEFLKDYDYFLPQNLIASKPILPKENAKLLVYKKNEDEILHLHFKDLSEILPHCDIIFNNTKVIKARIYGKKSTGGEVELLLNSPLNDNKFSVYIKGRVKKDTILNFDENLNAKICEIFDDGLRIVKFCQNDKILDAQNLYQILNKIGHTPLPPYIKRDDTKEDESWYQTIFAKHYGAVAAPTASLHFSEKMLQQIKISHKISYLTLHVGAGTFKSVECKNIKNHKMHGEIFEIPDETAKIIDGKNKILGVGTTVTRCIENYVRNHEKSGICELFLNPQNPPIRQNFLLTNFHLPKSTLIMLVASFIGLENTKKIYKIAVDKKYRFYSYGDGMLII